MSLLLAGTAPAVALAAGAGGGNGSGSGSASSGGSGAGGTAASGAVAGGWGRTSQYLGRYHLTPAHKPVAAMPVPPAGLFTPVLRAASQLQTVSGPVSSGQLEVFLRKVKSTEPLAPSGVLSVFGPGGSQVLYLTDLALHGKRRVAVVNGGSFTGVPIGSFTATPGQGAGTLNAVIKAHGLGAVRVRLKRFTATTA